MTNKNYTKLLILLYLSVVSISCVSADSLDNYDLLIESWSARYLEMSDFDPEILPTIYEITLNESGIIDSISFGKSNNMIINDIVIDLSGYSDIEYISSSSGTTVLIQDFYIDIDEQIISYKINGVDIKVVKSSSSDLVQEFDLYKNNQFFLSYVIDENSVQIIGDHQSLSVQFNNEIINSITRDSNLYDIQSIDINEYIIDRKSPEGRLLWRYNIIGNISSENPLYMIANYEIFRHLGGLDSLFILFL